MAPPLKFILINLVSKVTDQRSPLVSAHMDHTQHPESRRSEYVYAKAEQTPAQKEAFHWARRKRAGGVKGSERMQNKEGKMENQAVKQEPGTGNVKIWSWRAETQRLQRD